MKNLLSIVFPCCTYVSSVMGSSWHFSTSGLNICFPSRMRMRSSSRFLHISVVYQSFLPFLLFSWCIQWIQYHDMTVPHSIQYETVEFMVIYVHNRRNLTVKWSVCVLPWDSYSVTSCAYRNHPCISLA